MTSKQESSPKQSRIGKMPVEIPAGVKFSQQGQTMRVEGPKGKLELKLRPEVEVKEVEGKLRVTPKSKHQGAMFQGLTRSLLYNAVEGVSKGYNLSLDFRGVGYRVEIKTPTMIMNVGLSHKVEVTIPNDISVNVATVDEDGLKFPRVALESHNKELLGRFASHLRSKRPPEPYKGKGVRYMGEQVKQKAGKAGKGSA